MQITTGTMVKSWATFNHIGMYNSYSVLSTKYGEMAKNIILDMNYVDYAYWIILNMDDTKLNYEKMATTLLITQKGHHASINEIFDLC